MRLYLDRISAEKLTDRLLSFLGRREPSGLAVSL